MSVRLDGLADLNRTFKKISVSMRSPELSKARADKFKIHAARLLLMVGMKPNKPATVKIQGSAHPPVSWSQQLIDAIEVRTEKNSEAGFFSGSTKRPSPRALSDGKMSGGNLTFTEIAILMTSGFRIPLSGPKGDKVRAFLARYGIFMKKSKMFLSSPARPFLSKIADLFRAQGIDEMAVDSFLNGVWSKL